MTDRECPSCTRKGYAPDNVWPATDEFWRRRNGRLHFGACKACCNEREAAQPGRRMKAICRKHATALREGRAA